MRKIEKNILFSITLLFSGYLNAATITWDNVNKVATGNEIFTMDIVGLGFLDNVDGGGVNLAFDASVLNVLSVSIDPVVWDFGGTGISTGAIDNIGGTVNGIMVNTFANVLGDFIVATVQFEVLGGLGLGSSSSLGLTEYDLNPWASGGFAINPSYINGNVSVVPVPAAVWLFGSGLLGLIGMARRKARI